MSAVQRRDLGDTWGGNAHLGTEAPEFHEPVVTVGRRHAHNLGVGGRKPEIRIGPVAGGGHEQHSLAARPANGVCVDVRWLCIAEAHVDDLHIRLRDQLGERAVPVVDPAVGTFDDPSVPVPFFGHVYAGADRRNPRCEPGGIQELTLPRRPKRTPSWPGCTTGKRVEDGSRTPASGHNQTSANVSFHAHTKRPYPPASGWAAQKASSFGPTTPASPQSQSGGTRSRTSSTSRTRATFTGPSRFSPLSG